MDYPIIISRLSDDEGGGYVGYAPDLMGCIGDGETPEAALADTQSAILEWLDAAAVRGLAVPEPHSKSSAARKERDNLVAALKELGDSVETLDGRVDELARRISEIEESIENSDAWDRFTSVTGHHTGDRQLVLTYRD
jgi:antitoxin HicB